MTPHDTANFWVAFVLVGVPLIVLTGDPIGWRFLILLGALAGMAYAPLTAFVIIILYLLRAPLRWALEGLIIGFTGGIDCAYRAYFRAPSGRSGNVKDG